MPTWSALEKEEEQDMPELQNIRLPEGFSQFMEDTGLLLPPVPLWAVNWLEQTDDNFFATDMRPVQRMDMPADMDALFEAWPHAEASSRRGGEERPAGEGTGGGSEDAPSATAGFSGYAGFGIRGYGFQGRCATFLVETGGLRLGVSLPWGCAFGDPEDERAELAAAFRVAELCLRHIPATGRLCVFIGQDGCFWHRQDGGSERAGDTVDSLLNELEEHGGAAEEAVPSYQWMRV